MLFFSGFLGEENKTKPNSQQNKTIPPQTEHHKTKPTHFVIQFYKILMSSTNTYMSSEPPSLPKAELQLAQQTPLTLRYSLVPSTC